MNTWIWIQLFEPLLCNESKFVANGRNKTIRFAIVSVAKGHFKSVANSQKRAVKCRILV